MALALCCVNNVRANDLAAASLRPCLRTAPCNGYSELCCRQLQDIAFAMAANPLESSWTAMEQLQRGIRGFFLRVVDTGAGRAKICSSDASPRTGSLSGTETSRCYDHAQLVVTVAKFLSLPENEGAIVILVYEDFGNVLWSHDWPIELTDSLLATLPVDGTSYPTLGELIASGKRVIIFYGDFSAGTAVDPFGSVRSRQQQYPPWAHRFEDYVDTLSVRESRSLQQLHAAASTEKPVSASLGKFTFLWHHITTPSWWNTLVAGQQGGVLGAANFETLMNRTTRLRATSTKINFLAVTSPEVGLLLQAVDALNGFPPRPYVCDSRISPCCPTSNPSLGPCSGHGSCDTLSGRCVCNSGYEGSSCSCRRKPNGGACEEQFCFMRDEDCGDLAVCETLSSRGWISGVGQCVQRRPAGERCFADGQCMSGQCDMLLRCQELVALTPSCPASLPSSHATCKAWCDGKSAGGVPLDFRFTAKHQQKCCECIFWNSTQSVCSDGVCSSSSSNECCAMSPHEKPLTEDMPLPLLWAAPLSCAFVVAASSMCYCYSRRQVHFARFCVLVGNVCIGFVSIVLLVVAAVRGNPADGTLSEIYARVRPGSAALNVSMQPDALLRNAITASALLLAVALLGAVTAFKQSRRLLLVQGLMQLSCVAIVGALASFMINLSRQVQEEAVKVQLDAVYTQLASETQAQYTVQELADIQTAVCTVLGWWLLFPPVFLQTPVILLTAVAYHELHATARGSSYVRPHGRGRNEVASSEQFIAFLTFIGMLNAPSDANAVTVYAMHEQLSSKASTMPMPPMRLLSLPTASVHPLPTDGAATKARAAVHAAPSARPAAEDEARDYVALDVNVQVGPPRSHAREHGVYACTNAHVFTRTYVRTNACVPCRRS